MNDRKLDGGEEKKVDDADTEQLNSSGTSTDQPSTRLNSPFRGIYRLALKELKEILRDRRTIITLIGMPLLIYPLVSILFQKYYLSAASGTKDSAYRYCIEEKFLDQQGQAVEGPPLAAESDYEIREKELHDEFVREYVNLGEAYLFPELELPDYYQVAPLEKGQPEVDFVRANEPKYFDQNLFRLRRADDPEMGELVKSGKFDVGIRLIRERGSPSRCMLIHSDSAISVRAANYLRRRIDATHLVSAENQLANIRQRMNRGGSSVRRADYSVEVFESESVSGAVSMASLVPLILILMTVTGAVYPAIDLTAGERERGTLEALIAAPIPRFQVLFAKFIGVLVVAMLTAVVNMVGMFSTLAVFGMLPILFGEGVLTLFAILQVFLLLLLFAGFFSAVLLAVTSFARSFKEAQAYIIPLMLLSITPGVLSLTPGIHLQGIVTVVPLVNIVLLAKEIMLGTASGLPAIVAISSTVIYGLAAISVAANIFGSDSILYGSQTSWKSLVRRPQRTENSIHLSRALSCLAVLFPLSFLSIGVVSRVPAWIAGFQGIEVAEVPYVYNLAPFVLSTLLVFVLVPWLFLWHGRIQLRPSLKIQFGKPLGYLAAVLIGCSMWILIGELVYLLNEYVFVSQEQGELQTKLLEQAKKVVAKWRTVNPLLIIGCFSIVPAVCEEFFFRGILLRALIQKNRAIVAVLLSALTFGVFHTLSLTDLSSQKFLPSFLAGILLAWVALKSNSILPGMILHSLNNGILVSAAYYEDRLVKMGWIGADQEGFPMWMIGIAALMFAAGFSLLVAMRKDLRNENDSNVIKSEAS